MKDSSLVELQGGTGLLAKSDFIRCAYLLFALAVIFGSNILVRMNWSVSFGQNTFVAQSAVLELLYSPKSTYVYLSISTSIFYLNSEISGISAVFYFGW